MSISRVIQRAFCTALQSKSTPNIKSFYTDLYRERSLKCLVEKFKKSSEVDRFRTRSRIYEHIIRRLASAKRFKWIEEILEDQKKYNDFSKEGFAVRLISLYGKSGMFENAQTMFDEMPEKNVKQTVLSFNALLAAYVNSKKFDMVDGVFREVPTKLKIEPDLVSYNTIIKAYCATGSSDKAILMLDEMDKKGVAPDVISFNTILHGLYANGQFYEGEKIWSLMGEKNVVPDVRSYNSKLLGLAAEKKTKEAVNLIGEMRSKGVEPDIFSFNSLIKGFVNEDNFEGAKQWYAEIGNSNCSSDKLTFETLIPFACEKGDLDLAFSLTKEIFQRRFLFDASLLQRVVDDLVKRSKVEEAKEVVKLGKTNSYRRYKLKLPSGYDGCSFHTTELPSASAFHQSDHIIC